MGFRSPDLKRASLPTLKTHITRAKKKIEKLEKDLNLAKTQEVEQAPLIAGLLARLLRSESELSRLKQVRQQRPGIFGSLFGLTERPQEVSSAILALESEIYEINRTKYEIEQLPSKIARLEESIRRTGDWIERLEQSTVRHTKKREKLAALRAAAAANTSQARAVGASVKRNLRKQQNCPYCGCPLGPDAHADHIYPLSKGGRSVHTNMVHACGQCNSKKRDMTLTAFIRKFSLDREAIESELERLGKEY